LLGLVVDQTDNFGEVGNGVADQLWDEGEWVLEDVRPFFNSSDVVLDTFAISKLVWNLLKDLSNNFDSINNTRYILLHEVLDSLSKLGLNNCGVFETLVDLFEVIFVNQDLDHSINEVLDVHW